MGIVVVYCWHIGLTWYGWYWTSNGSIVLNLKRYNSANLLNYHRLLAKSMAMQDLGIPMVVET